MGKKKGYGKPGSNEPQEAAGPVLRGALAFWAGAVLSHGAAAHLVMGIDVASSLILLALVLALVGWAVGGGMTRAEDFRQTKGIIGMAIACLLLVLVGSLSYSTRSSAGLASDAESGSDRWVPPLPGLDTRTDEEPAGFDASSGHAMAPEAPLGPMGSSLFGMMGAAAGSPSEMSLEPPSDAELEQVVLRARRYFYGWLHDDLPLMENESAASHVSELAALERPAPPEQPVPFEQIDAGEPSVRTNWIRVPVTGGGRSGRVVLGRSLGWEVVGIDVVE